MKYLCLDMTGQCVVHVRGDIHGSNRHPNVLDWLIFFFLSVLWC